MSCARLLVALALCLGAAVAFGEQLPPFPTCAATSGPGSSDDTGFAPRENDRLWLCEEGQDKAAAFLSESVFKCYRTEFDDAGRATCIAKARSRLLSSLPGPSNAYPCPACLDRPAMMDEIVVRYRAFADRVMCDGGMSACQKKVLQAAGRLSLRIIGMHMGLWAKINKGGCTQPFEDHAKHLFYSQTKRVVDCPACLDLTTYANDVEYDVDSHNGEIFCATESDLR